MSEVHAPTSGIGGKSDGRMKIMQPPSCCHERRWSKWEGLVVREEPFLHTKDDAAAVDGFW